MNKVSKTFAKINNKKAGTIKSVVEQEKQEMATLIQMIGNASFTIPH